MKELGKEASNAHSLVIYGRPFSYYSIFQRELPRLLPTISHPKFPSESCRSHLDVGRKALSYCNSVFLEHHNGAIHGLSFLDQDLEKSTEIDLVEVKKLSPSMNPPTSRSHTYHAGVCSRSKEQDSRRLGARDLPS